jgi:hypothetical protein
MKKLFIIIALAGLVACAGCATQIKDMAQNYGDASAELKNFARISAQDWLFGSGIIQGAVPQDAMPAWFFDELEKVDAWFEDNPKAELTEHQIGYIVGVRIRMAGPLIRAAIEQYAPGILTITEVGAVLAFIGL